MGVGVMDIQKEREAFEQALVSQKNVSINNLHVCTIFDAEKNKYSPSDVCDPKEDFIVDWINSSWSIWQAAKAQAVPEKTCSIQGHEIIINETKNELINDYDIAKEDEYLLEALVYRGVCIGKSQAVPECVWVESYDGSVFESSCGHTFELSNDGTLDDNNMKHCCFCGGKIDAQEQSHD